MGLPRAVATARGSPFPPNARSREKIFRTQNDVWRGVERAVHTPVARDRCAHALGSANRFTWALDIVAGPEYSRSAQSFRGSKRGGAQRPS